MKKIRFSHTDYILVRTEYEDTNHPNMSLYSFDTLKKAREYAFKDIKETMKNFDIDYSRENDKAVSYQKYCGNDYWYWENSEMAIDWEIRTINCRTTSSYENCESIVEWVSEEK